MKNVEIVILSMAIFMKHPEKKTCKKPALSSQKIHFTSS